MNIKITTEAQEALQEYKLPEGYGLRIEGELTGG
jgi:hypothetical protein